jgi:pimeloyl-ACP methyl ester carboxylesterase
MPYFETSDHVHLHFTDWGTGQPAVFCHAWGLNQDSWQYQVPALVAAGMRCITYDRRGHGRSDRPGTGYDVETLADDLAALLDHLGLDEVSVVGHSIGCREIVAYASRHGQARLERAGFLAPLLPNVGRAFTAEQMSANVTALKRDVPGWCAANASPFFGDRVVSHGLVDWVARQIIDTSLPVLLATMAGYVVDFEDQLRDFTVPTLVIHGDADASAPLEHTGRLVADLVKDGELVVIPGAGHGLYAADHVVVNEHLVRFLRRDG